MVGREMEERADNYRIGPWDAHPLRVTDNRPAGLSRQASAVRRSAQSNAAGGWPVEKRHNHEKPATPSALCAMKFINDIQL